MRTVYAIVLCILAATSACAGDVAGPVRPTPVIAALKERAYPIVVTSVVDGDTVEARIYSSGVFYLPGEEFQHTLFVNERIRIAGINAPEVKGACKAERKMARDVAELLGQKLLNKEAVLVTTVGHEKEKFGRVLGDIRVKGQSIAKELIDSGKVDAYKGGRRDPQRWCRETKE